MGFITFRNISGYICITQQIWYSKRDVASALFIIIFDIACMYVYL